MPIVWSRTLAAKAGEEYLELSNLEKPLRIGEAIGDVDERRAASG